MKTNDTSEKQSGAGSGGSSGESGFAPAKFGIKTVIITAVLASTAAVLGFYVMGGFGGDPPTEKPEPGKGGIPVRPIEKPEVPVKVPEPPAEVPEPPAEVLGPPAEGLERPVEETEVEEPKVEVPDIHPLRGRKHIYYAVRGSEWRRAPLSWSLELEPELDHPIITVERREATVWEFQEVANQENHYRIYYRGADPKWDGAQLSYSRTKGSQPPYATIEKDDDCIWEIALIEGSGSHYEITCELKKGGFYGRPLVLRESDEHGLKANHPIAVIGEEHGRARWRVLSEGELPPAPERDYIIIFPRKDLDEDAREKVKEWAGKIEGHIEDGGPGTLRLALGMSDGSEIACRYEGEPYRGVKARMREMKDPAEPATPESGKIPGGIQDVMEGLGIGGGEASTGTGEGDGDPAGLNDIRKWGPFPVVIPVQFHGELEVENIESLELWDDGFWTGFKGLEKVKGFQSARDETVGVGRVFHGEMFTYVFVRFADGGKGE